MQDMNQIHVIQESAMMKSLYKISKDWDTVEYWLSWADSNEFLFRIFNNNTLLGFSVARPVKNLEETKNYYYYEEDGDTICVDIACSTIYNGTKKLWKEIAGKFNNFKYVAFRRNGGKMKTYNFTRFTELMKVGA